MMPQNAELSVAHEDELERLEERVWKVLCGFSRQAPGRYEAAGLLLTFDTATGALLHDAPELQSAPKFARQALRAAPVSLLSKVSTLASILRIAHSLTPLSQPALVCQYAVMVMSSYRNRVLQLHRLREARGTWAVKDVDDGATVVSLLSADGRTATLRYRPSDRLPFHVQCTDACLAQRLGLVLLPNALEPE